MAETELLLALRTGIEEPFYPPVPPLSILPFSQNTSAAAAAWQCEMYSFNTSLPWCKQGIIEWDTRAHFCPPYTHTSPSPSIFSPIMLLDATHPSGQRRGREVVPRTSHPSTSTGRSEPSHPLPPLPLVLCFQIPSPNLAFIWPFSLPALY